MMSRLNRISFTIRSYHLKNYKWTNMLNYEFIRYLGVRTCVETSTENMFLSECRLRFATCYTFLIGSFLNR